MKKLGTVDVFDYRDELWDYVGDTKVGFRVIVLLRSDDTHHHEPIYDIYASNNKTALKKIAEIVDGLK